MVYERRTHFKSCLIIRGVQDVKAMSSMYARFIAMAEKKHTCPLCTRSFDDQLETQFVGRVSLECHFKLEKYHH